MNPKRIISSCIIFLLTQCYCSGILVRSNEFPTKKPKLKVQNPILFCLVPPFRGDDEILSVDNQKLPKAKRRTHLNILQDEFTKRSIKSVIIEKDEDRTNCTEIIVFENIEVKSYYRNIHGASTLSLLTLYLIPDWTKYKVAEIEFTDSSGRIQTKGYTLVIDWLLLQPVTFFNMLFLPDQKIADNSDIWSRFADSYLGL